MVFRTVSLTLDFWSKQPTLPHCQEEKVVFQVISHSGKKDLAGVIKGHLIHFSAMRVIFSVT